MEKKHFGREICEKCETCKAREPSEKCATKKSQCAQIVLISFPQKNSTTAWCTPPPSSCWLHAEPVEKWKVWVARRPLARGGATQHQDVARDSSSRHLTLGTSRQIAAKKCQLFSIHLGQLWSMRSIVKEFSSNTDALGHLTLCASDQSGSPTTKYQK